MAKVFISWSGDISLGVAKALHEWLPYVLQSVRPWMSTDITAGKAWSAEIQSELAASNLGVLCLTKVNLTAPWLLFEAGALAFTEARVIPYRFRLKVDDIGPPLSLFQSVGDDQTGTWSLIKTINEVSANPLKDEHLKGVFKTFWPKLNASFGKIAKDDERNTARLRNCQKELADYPRGPAIDDLFIPHSFIQAIADEINERTLILDLVSEANKLRQAIDPADANVTIIRIGLLVMNDSAYAAWQSVFREARLNSPRMLAAILMVLPVTTDLIEQERDLLLSRLKTRRSPGGVIH